MATSWKSLGQAAPAAAALTTLYTVPFNTETVCQVVVANRAKYSTMFRIAVAPDGAADTEAQYIAYDQPIGGSNTFVTLKLTLNSTDVVRVYATNGVLSFNLMGIEREVTSV